MPTWSDEAPRLLAVHPQGPVWPENILRFHLCFDREMNPADSAANVEIETADGAAVRGALADFPDGLWSPDGTVLTVLLHPGRVKQGLAAHQRWGRALSAGHAYRIRIGPGLADMAGRRLGRACRIAFHCAAAEDRPLDPGQWRWHEPEPGGRDPITIATGRQLDALSLPGAVRLIDPGGAVHPAEFSIAGDIVTAVPRAPWGEGLMLEVAPWLEDVCGNRPAQAFESAPRPASAASVVAVPLRAIRGPGNR